MIEIRCAKCQRLAHIPGALSGQIVKCRSCGHAMKVVAQTEVDQRQAQEAAIEAKRDVRREREQAKIQAEMGIEDAQGFEGNEAVDAVEALEKQTQFEGLSQAAMQFGNDGGTHAGQDAWDLQQLAATQVGTVDTATMQGSESQGRCHACGSMIREGALICVVCGQVLGDEKALAKAMRGSGSQGGVAGGLFAGLGAMIGGLAAAVVGGACWAAMSVGFGMELGGAAFVLALVIALIMVKLSGGQRHWMLGVMAVMMTVTAIGVGKFGIAFYGLAEMRSQNGAREMRMLEAAVVLQLVREGAFERETSEKLLAVDWEKKQRLEMSEKDYAKVAERMRVMGQGQKVDVVKRYWIEPKIRQMSGQDKLKAVISWIDGVWLGMGSVVAFGVAGFGRGGSDT